MPHIHDKIDFTSEVFIVYKNKVLLRKHDKYKIWLSIGGHIELDEDPIEAAEREVLEEVGLKIEIHDSLLKYRGSREGYIELIPPRFMNRHRINENHEHISLVYFARSDSDNVKVSGDDISNVWKWFDHDELDDKEYGINDNVKFYARRALDELFTD
ncbi:NUDIX domain-containing protein [Candidatus Woesearchaeota archaeon]|nr:NUDIX domain-containing protein [Candidatus Woesearchaeota archaeon]